MVVAVRRALGLALAVTCLPASADFVTVITFGGANKDVQKEAFFKPFKASTGDAVVHGSYNGDLDKLKSMIDISHVTWDVVEVEAPELARGCEEGLFEKIDPALVGNPSDFVAGALQPCGVGIFVWSTVLAYDSARIKDAPRGWADFWDLRKYPGKRGLRHGAKYNLEFALMADGVAPNEVYQVLDTPAGVDRAFRKLDEIKSSVVWWKSGAEPVRALQDGKVAMSSAYNGRIATAQKETRSLAMAWNGNIYDFDYWALPKGSWKGELAKKFVHFVSQPDQQKAFAEGISYSPVNNKAIAMINPAIAATLPTAPQNIRDALPMNVTFWAAHADLEARFESWVKN
ncbi:ABC transporter substrate-binding protein [Metapseudomonas otitidis]|uniref:ABC transporter substrate-binding protein n=1 Tax=Metapseudomonas otitidis TaxID=319939 RepID=UPI00244BE633|nr:ABC transporter substrate-binding protein [Pseudomonas otitidis]MDH0335781.1 ABC transporter substrate-binding protein [Pseudomonas otitidis]